MPLPVTPWTADTPITAKSLNLALYTIDGTLDKPQGILLQGQRPMSFEVIGEAGGVLLFTSSSAGHRNIIAASGDTEPAVTVLDSAGYYGQSTDGVYWFAGYAFTPVIAGTTGDGVTPGGLTIACHFIPVNGTTSTTLDSAGADMDNGGVFLNAGSRQRPPGSTPGTYDVCPFYLDLLETSGTDLQPAVYLVDSSSTAGVPVYNATDSSGETPRFFTLWAAVSAAQNASYGNPAFPVPYAGPYTSATTIGTSGGATVNVNGANGITGPVNFLANPPVYRNSLSSSQSIPNATTTKVTLNSTATDNYSGYTAASSTYTVQRAGLYLAHGNVAFSANTGGHRVVGIAVNGTTYWGPGYQAAPAGLVIATKTQIFSLQAGDTVTLEVQQDSGGSLALSNTEVTRIFLAWLGEEGVPSTLWTPPDTSYRWAAGTAGTDLPGLFQAHLANDLGFLCNPPYLMAYQTVAQTGLANNSSNAVALDTVGGIVHSDNGDNYSGFSTGTSKYTAQVAGWYLAVCEAFGTTPGTPTTASLKVGLQVSTSGGRTPSTAIDWYQQMFPSSSNFPPGGTAVGLYYLAAGETIRAIIDGQAYTGGTWGTTAATATASHLELVWVSN